MQLGLELASPLRVAVLGSGSAGNSLVVESGSRRIMVDAGFPCRELEKRLGLLELDPAELDAVVLTHEHSDHTRGVARLASRHRLPVAATSGTLQELGLDPAKVSASPMRSGAPFELGGFQIEPFAIPHDAREPVGLVIEDASGQRVGVVADLGTCSRLAWGRLRDLDLLVLETNHDLEMLRNGPYPWPLKQRVAGRHGHLSNRAAAEGLVELIGERLRWVVLYHLSRTNNLPVLAEEAVVAELVRAGSDARTCLSSQSEPTGWLDLDGQVNDRIGAVSGSL